MAYATYPITLASNAATLLWRTTAGDDPTYTIAPSSQIFQAGSGNNALPILIVVPTSTTLYICPSGATADTNLAPLVGPFYLPLNVVGSDSMYGIAATGTPVVYVIVGQQ